jgi:transposase-like protein
MMPSNDRAPELNPREIVRLYVEEELSVREIANQFGTNYARIYHILRSRVTMRGRGTDRSRRGRKHQEIKEIIRQRIVTGDWQPRRKILNNHQLGQILGVGPQTVEGVIADLRDQGYIRTLAKGNYVRPPEDWPESEEGPGSS